MLCVVLKLRQFLVAGFAADAPTNDFSTFGAASCTAFLVQFCAGTLNHDSTCIEIDGVEIDLDRNRGRGIYRPPMRVARKLVSTLFPIDSDQSVETNPHNVSAVRALSRWATSPR